MTESRGREVRCKVIDGQYYEHVRSYRWSESNGLRGMSLTDHYRADVYVCKETGHQFTKDHFIETTER